MPLWVKRGDKKSANSQGVGDGQDAGDQAHDDTTNVGVLGLVVDLTASEGCQRQDEDDGIQPDTTQAAVGDHGHIVVLDETTVSLGDGGHPQS